MSTSTIEIISTASSVIAAMATLALVYVAYCQLSALNKQKKAEFLFAFRNDFFKDKQNQNILRIIEEQKPLFKKNGGDFDEYNIDDYLDVFDLAGNYIKKKILDFDLADEAFGNYIVKAFQNQEIKQYIESLRIEYKDERYLEPFTNLAIKLEKRENQEREKFINKQK